MTTKSKLITALILSNSAVIATDFINKYIKFSSTKKKLLKNDSSFFYHWRLGNIHYTKHGTGAPLLLIHDLNAASSLFQWNSIIPYLSKKYTVYAIDLLGCGLSEKPYITYTSLTYIQQISDFIKFEIGHRTDVIALGNSGNFIMTACNNFPELFNRIILVNPESILSSCKIPGKYARLYKNYLDLPVIGTLLYNISFSKHALRETLRKYYFYNPSKATESYVESYYEAAHFGYCPKAVFSSIRCNYTNYNITNAIKKIDNSIYLIGGEQLEHEKEIMEEYVVQNPAIEFTMIQNAKFLPHVENPVEFLLAVKIFFS